MKNRFEDAHKKSWMFFSIVGWAVMLVLGGLCFYAWEQETIFLAFGGPGFAVACGGAYLIWQEVKIRDAKIDKMCGKVVNQSELNYTQATIRASVLTGVLGLVMLVLPIIVLSAQAKKEALKEEKARIAATNNVEYLRCNINEPEDVRLLGALNLKFKNASFPANYTDLKINSKKTLGGEIEYNVSLTTSHDVYLTTKKIPSMWRRLRGLVPVKIVKRAAVANHPADVKITISDNWQRGRMSYGNENYDLLIMPSLMKQEKIIFVEEGSAAETQWHTLIKNLNNHPSNKRNLAISKVNTILKSHIGKIISKLPDEVTIEGI